MVFFRPKPPYHRIYNKDIILLTHPKENNVVKQRVKQKLYEQGHIISAFEFDKTWDYRTVINKMHEAFKGKISCGNLVCNHAYAGVYNDLRFSLKCLIKFYKTLSKFLCYFWLSVWKYSCLVATNLLLLHLMKARSSTAI